MPNRERKFPHLEVKGGPSGYDTQVLLDGKPRAVSELDVHMGVNDVSQVTLTHFVSVDLDVSIRDVRSRYTVRVVWEEDNQIKAVEVTKESVPRALRYAASQIELGKGRVVGSLEGSVRTGDPGTESLPAEGGEAVHNGSPIEGGLGGT